MNKMALGFVGVVMAFLVISAVVVVSQGIGINNTSIKFEKDIQAQYGQNKNSYDNYFKKVQESAQIPSKYSDDLKSVYTAAIQGRYGRDGSKATWQWIQEHNPNLDPSLYRQIQQVIESGRNDFQSNQTTLLDKKRVYETFIATFPNSVYVKFLGFPKIDLAKYDIVTSGDTEQAFETKRADKIQVFSK
jgi:hypothetical protein